MTKERELLMMKNNQEFIEKIEDTPIIPAVKNDESLKECLKGDSRVVFILYGDICNIADIVERVKACDKLALVHMDLIGGLSSKDISVEFIKNKTRADGIITTKPALVKKAKELGLYTVLRFFVIDSLALSNLDKQTKEANPDCIEVLPGVMPKIIKKIVNLSNKTLIAGGLISDKEDICNALDAGATAVSTTNPTIWDI